MGWFGVQLFFIASSLTLMQSWHAEKRRSGTVSVRSFFLRRYFRIAPAYYLAALLYTVLAPPSAGYSAWRIISCLAFLNALDPSWALNTQSLVPGGWSIGVEFAFYAIFPLFAAFATSTRRALLLSAGLAAFGLSANLVALSLLSLSMSPTQLSEGLFFWFPNEVSVFGLGAVAYFGIEAGHPVAAFVKRHSTAIPVVGAALFMALAYVKLGAYLGDDPPVPATLAVSLIFLVVIVALSGARSLFANGPFASLGKVSFSAYLLHFAVLHLLGAFPSMFHTEATGIQAIAAFAACWPVAMRLTFGASSLSWALIEEPMIRVGKSLGAKRAPLALVTPTPSG